MQSLLAKFAPALLPMAVLLLGGVQAALVDDVFSEQEGWQFAILGAGAIVTYIVPLLQGSWAAALKVLANVVAAIAVILVDLLANGTITWDLTTVTLVAIGALQALGAQIGVDVRLDQAKEVIDSRENPGVPTITSLDPAAVNVVAHDGRH